MGAPIGTLCGDTGNLGLAVRASGGSVIYARVAFDCVGTFRFLVCILDVIEKRAPAQLVELAIGLALTGIHIVDFNGAGVTREPCCLRRSSGLRAPMAWATTEP
jgi:glycerol uptake facilitator-like aquaporin